MVIITINGKKNVREFQNMAQALAFAAQNGDCIKSEKLELAYVSQAKKPGAAPAAGSTTSGGGSSGGSTTSGGGSASGPAK